MFSPAGGGARPGGGAGVEAGGAGVPLGGEAGQSQLCTAELRR